MSDKLLATMEKAFRGSPTPESERLGSTSSTRIDVNARMREMW